MKPPIFHHQLSNYRQWKARVLRAVQELQDWLAAEGRANEKTDEQIRTTLAALESDRLTIAFVAEFSRGKSELINAIFFADTGRRLLPSTAGRTTMCPTELWWDDDRDEPYLRLLPVETRADEAPVSELKKDLEQWAHLPLRPQDPEQMTSALEEIQQTKLVSPQEATRLGLSSSAVAPDGERDGKHVAIPKWRHAIVSFPHPLLKKGLTILDTPGLNSLGSEPELTLGMLHQAQAVLFVLGADTGVTRSDLEMWQHHLKGFQSGRQRGIVVALNKIDTLWDELKDKKSIDAAIEQQRVGTARTLGISDGLIFPVSAQKGLVAKIRDDHQLLRNSAIERLEDFLSDKLMESKHQCLLEIVEANAGKILERNRARVTTRIRHVKNQLKELEQLGERSDDAIEQFLDKTRVEQEVYLKSVRKFRDARSGLIAETQLSRRLLDQLSLDTMVDRTHEIMVRSWTTHGLNSAMKQLFDELRRIMQTVTSESERQRKFVRRCYQEFCNELGLDVVAPKVFAPMKFRVEIELLYQEVNAFRRSPAMALTEQGVVIRRFHQQMVSRAMALFQQLRDAHDGWIRDALQPLAEEIQEHKGMMERRLENLQRIGQSKESIEKRAADMQRQYVELAKRLTALRNIHNAMHYDPTLDSDRIERPRLVAKA